MNKPWRPQVGERVDYGDDSGSVVVTRVYDVDVGDNATVSGCVVWVVSDDDPPVDGWWWVEDLKPRKPDA